MLYKRVLKGVEFGCDNYKEVYEFFCKFFVDQGVRCLAWSYYYYFTFVLRECLDYAVVEGFGFLRVYRPEDEL